jgi:hypothetical protein
MKKSIRTILGGFGALLGILVWISIPPESWAVFLGIGAGLLFCLILIRLVSLFLTAAARKDEMLREIIRQQQEDRALERRAFYEDRRHERLVGAATYRVILEALESGIRIGEVKGRAALKYPDGRVLDAERQCQMSPEAIQLMYREQTRFLPEPEK